VRIEVRLRHTQRNHPHDGGVEVRLAEVSSGFAISVSVI
jgi:hypothetical protein